MSLGTPYLHQQAEHLTDRLTALGARLRAAAPTWRAFLIAALLLIPADFCLRIWVGRELGKDDFQLPWRSAALAREYASHLATNNGPLVVMLGDSTLQQIPHRPDDFTTPSLIQQELRRRSHNPAWKVANFGLTGAHMGDMANLARLLPDNVDLVVITLNLKFFGPTTSQPVTTFEELWPQNDPFSVGTALARSIDHPFEMPHLLDRLLNDRLYLLRNGGWAADQWFDDRLGQWLRWHLTKGPLREGVSRIKTDLTHRPPLDATTWENWYIANMRSALDINELTLDNPSVKQLGAMLLLLRRRMMPTIVYATPLDLADIAKYGVADPDRIRSLTQILGRHIEKSGALFLDFTSAGADDWFLDMDHLTNKGKQEMAGRLVKQALLRLPMRGSGWR